MLISCNSCNSRYLVNSADLKPNGRQVQCAKCGNKWFQESLSSEEQVSSNLSSSIPESSVSEIKSSSSKYNLPSTYVEEQKVSIINSILVTVALVLIIFIFWFLNNIELNTIVLIKFYVNEFLFNLKLIANDIAKIIHQIIN